MFEKKQICFCAGTYGRIAPRSGLALKHGLDVGAGVLDPDYRGPVGVMLFNHDAKAEFKGSFFRVLFFASSSLPAVKVGDRVAQLILEKIATPDIQETDELDPTYRLVFYLISNTCCAGRAARAVSGPRACGAPPSSQSSATICFLQLP